MLSVKYSLLNVALPLVEAQVYYTDTTTTETHKHNLEICCRWKKKSNEREGQ